MYKIARIIRVGRRKAGAYALGEELLLLLNAFEEAHGVPHSAANEAEEPAPARNALMDVCAESMSQMSDDEKRRRSETKNDHENARKRRAL